MIHHRPMFFSFFASNKVGKVKRGPPANIPFSKGFILKSTAITVKSDLGCSSYPQ